MNNKQLSVLLGTCIIPGMAKALGVPDDRMVEFLDKLYRSSMYDILIREDSAAWHLSAATLADIYLEEQRSGNLEWPEEQ
jgi:hypothetical protein